MHKLHSQVEMDKKYQIKLFKDQYDKFIQQFDDKTELDFLNQVFVSTRADNPFKKSGFVPYKLVWDVIKLSILNYFFIITNVQSQKCLCLDKEIRFQSFSTEWNLSMEIVVSYINHATIAKGSVSSGVSANFKLIPIQPVLLISHSNL